MKKRLCSILIFCVLILLSSCASSDEVPVYDPDAIAPETQEELYSYYDKVLKNMTRDQIEEMFGEGKIKYDQDGIEIYHAYRNEKKSAGVNVIYNTDDTVYAKILYYNKAEDLVPFSNEYDAEKLSQIEEGQPLEKAEEILGKSLVIACTYSEQNNISQVSEIRSWFNADGTNFQIHTTDNIVTSRVLNRPEK